MNKVIIMGMTFAEGSVPDFGSIYDVCLRHNNVNDYGAASVSDASKLSNITNAAPGSTCLFSNGDIYRLEKSGWAKFGEDAEASASVNSVNLSPMNIDRASLLGDNGGDDLTVEGDDAENVHDQEDSENSEELI